MSARVIKNMTLLGKKREYGDLLTNEEISKIPARALDALIGSHAIDMVGAESNVGQAIGFGGGDQNFARLRASVDRLTDVVEAMIGRKLSDVDLKSAFKDNIVLEGNVQAVEFASEETEVVEQPTKSKPKAKTARAKAKPKAKSKAKVKPAAAATYKKGQKVSFAGEDNEVLTGSIIAVVKTRKVVNVKVGTDVWEVNFADIK